MKAWQLPGLEKKTMASWRVAGVSGVSIPIIYLRGMGFPGGFLVFCGLFERGRRIMQAQKGARLHMALDLSVKCKKQSRRGRAGWFLLICPA